MATYQHLYRQCEGSPRNVIQLTNELRALVPGTAGEAYQLQGDDLTIDDVVLTIASVLIGLSQIKYPFKISMGDPTFQKWSGNGDMEGFFLPQDSDAFIFPFEVDEARKEGYKRKRESRVTESGSPKAKRQQTSRGNSHPYPVLAICEPTDTFYDEFLIDTRSMVGSNPTTETQDLMLATETVKRALASSRWTGLKTTETPKFRNGAVVPPYADPHRPAYHAILRAWTYMLDLPVHEQPEEKPNEKIHDFYGKLRKLFNLALRGQMSYELLEKFLGDAGYIYPPSQARSHQCIPQIKYRRRLLRFRSVQIQTRTTWHDQLNRCLARADSIRRTLRGDESLKLPATPGIDDVRNAIGTLWRTTFDTSSRDREFRRVAFCSALAQTFIDPDAEELLMVHSANRSGEKPKGDSNTDLVISISRADKVSTENGKHKVRITHYGYGTQEVSTQVKNEAARTVKSSGWLGIDHGTVTYEHNVRISPLPQSASHTWIYATLIGWCRLLGLEVVQMQRCRGHRDNSPGFVEDGRRLIGHAFDGAASVEAIKAFVHAYGFSVSDGDPPSPFAPGSGRRTYANHADNDLQAFINRKQEGKPAPVTKKTATPKKTAAVEDPEPAGITQGTKRTKPKQKSKAGRETKEAKQAGPAPLRILSQKGDYKNPEKMKMYDATKHEATWMAEYKKHVSECIGKRATHKAAQPEFEEKPFTEHNKIPNDKATDVEMTGRAIVSLWTALWSQTVKFGIFDPMMLEYFKIEDGASGGIGTAAGGPHPLLMTLYASGAIRSPVVPAGVGHTWFAVAELRHPQPRGSVPTAAPCSPQVGTDRATSKKRIKALLDDSGADDATHVDIYIWDTMEKQRRGRSWEQMPEVQLARRRQKAKWLVRYCGWACGANVTAEGTLAPRNWGPTVKFHNMKCPQQDDASLNSRSIPCGLLTVLNAWRYMLGLPPARKADARGGEVTSEAFYNELYDCLDLAMTGFLTTRTIQAFLNAFGWLETEQDLSEGVVDATTWDTTDSSYQSIIQSIAQDNH